MQPDEQSASGQGIYDELKAIQKELDKCMHCGFCMAVCPIYATEKTEASVARGKVGVAEAVMEGKLALDDPEVIDMLFNCLVCKSCMQNCPTKVNFDRIMLSLRAAIVRKNGLPWLKKAIFSTLKHPALFDRGMKAGALLSGLAFRDAGQQAIAPRSPFAIMGKRAGFDENRLLPALAKEPLRDRLPDVVSNSKPKTKAAFFTGCSMNYFYPDTGMDLISVLRENNVEVSIPKDQGCCGIPVFVHGDVETIRVLAKRNLDAMDRTCADHLITSCGSCGGAWQHEYQEIFKDDPVYGPKAEYWSKRTYDISTFLVDVIKYRPPLGKVDAVVTYHDSCHLKKTMKVSSEPREILKHIPGVTFKEMSKPDACCGSGGSYVLTHFETSTAVAKRKVDDARRTGATTVTTGCPACMMQLSDNVNRFGKGQQIRHYISVLAESYRNEKQSL
ncbi:MAG TPA: (Fe-S)-binding protein [Candidatus Saccharimonadales bacterium]|nr:(Fe-S)-binding protein [Candidatus Saccharimonadales bacterium]